MKITLSLLLLMVFAWYFNPAAAHTYYFSSISGDDSRTSTQAQNSGAPWQTLTKLSSFFAGLQPGDRVLFKRGDVLPITIRAFGTGANPVITVFNIVTAWTNLGSNIWERSSVSSLSPLLIWL